MHHILVNSHSPLTAGLLRAAGDNATTLHITALTQLWSPALGVLSALLRGPLGSLLSSSYASSYRPPQVSSRTASWSR